MHFDALLAEKTFLINAILNFLWRFARVENLSLTQLAY